MITKAQLKILRNIDVDGFLAFLEAMGEPRPCSREVAVISIHKARAACPLLKYSEREASANWLTDRGYHADHFTPLKTIKGGRKT